MATNTHESKTQGNGHAAEFSNRPLISSSDIEKLSFETGEKIGEVASSLKEKASQYVRSGRDYVKEHPTTGVAVAAVAGLAVGSLLTMALRSRQS